MTACHVEWPVIRRKARGFSLVELAVVLLVVGMAMGMVGLPLLRASQQQQGSNPNALMPETAVGALELYALKHGYLPCPANPAASSQVGMPDCSMVDRTGWLPWAALGLGSGRDKWMTPLSYAVSRNYTDASGAAPSITFATAGAIRLTGLSLNAGSVSETDLGNYVAVVISHGPNRAGVGGGSVNNYESANLPGSSSLQPYYQAARDGSQERLDDLVWPVVELTLKNRLALAGRL